MAETEPKINAKTRRKQQLARARELRIDNGSRNQNVLRNERENEDNSCNASKKKIEGFLVDEFPDTPSDDNTWCIVNVKQMNDLFTNIQCPDCEMVGTMCMQPSDDRNGFAKKISLTCNNCASVSASSYTSPTGVQTGRGPKPFVVNDLFALFLQECGLGASAMTKFGAIFGMNTLHRKTFQKKQVKVNTATVRNCEDNMDTAAFLVREAHGVEDNNELLDITVSYDGTWHKRGHTSHYGVACVIDVLTGYVLDYEVLSTFCQICANKSSALGSESEEFRQWFLGHKDDCSKNYNGSANSMEVAAAKILWQRSVDKFNIRYTGFLSDGDSKAFNAVTQLNVYDTEIIKEDCINHAHKRMGTALLKKAKEEHLGGRGVGRLTQDKALKFQYYYRFAITNNIGNEENMRKAIWATLFHCMSTDQHPHHIKCPSGPDSWCFYKKAEHNKEKIPAHKDNIKYPLHPSVAKKLVPVYNRMSDPKLLKRMVKGKTQNPNESLHNVIWSRCPKTVFVGKTRLSAAVAGAIISFNQGASHLTQMMSVLAIEPNEITKAVVDKLDEARIKKCAIRNTPKAKQKRSEKWEVSKKKRAAQEKKEGPTYAPGGF